MKVRRIFFRFVNENDNPNKIFFFLLIDFFSDVEGIKLFAFHAKLNEEMNGREGGTFSRDITKAKNGRWTFYDPYTVLQTGDTLYYWTYVDYFDGRNKLGYTNDDRAYTVTDKGESLNFDNIQHDQII